jgi:hypothetical protein
MSSSAPLHPPLSVLHPNLALESFLQSLPPESLRQEKNPAPNTLSTEKLQAKQKLILQVADSLFGGGMLEGALTILDTYCIHELIVAAPSKRRIFVLVNGMQRREQEEPNHHFCLWPDSEGGFPFCSCRSFFERTKGSGPTQSLAVCKHLLALKLRPHLLDDCPVTEVDTEAALSKEVAQLLYEMEPGEEVETEMEMETDAEMDEEMDAEEQKEE